MERLNLAVIVCSKQDMCGVFRAMIGNVATAAERGGRPIGGIDGLEQKSLEELDRLLREWFWLYPMQAINPVTNAYSTEEEPEYLLEMHGDNALLGFLFPTEGGFIADELAELELKLPAGEYAIADAHCYGGDDEIYLELQNWDSDDGLYHRESNDDEAWFCPEDECTELDEFFELCDNLPDNPDESNKVELAKHKVLSLFQRAFR